MGVRSGKVEPKWIAERGAIVYEDVNLGSPEAPVVPSTPVTDPPPEIVDRYGPPWRQVMNQELQ
jgi:hypothetical protein